MSYVMKDMLLKSKIVPTYYVYLYLLQIILCILIVYLTVQITP